jgi:hypothetical protein
MKSILQESPRKLDMLFLKRNHSLPKIFNFDDKLKINICVTEKKESMLSHIFHLGTIMM